MPRPGRNAPKKRSQKPPPRVDDQRSIDKILPRSGESGNPNIPIRTVLYVEVQDMPVHLVREVAEMTLRNLPNEHPHYIVPMRFGKLLTEFEFEKEFLKTVKTLCEVKDGNIVIRDGAEQVDVIRKKI